MKEAIVYIALITAVILFLTVAVHHGMDIINLNLQEVLR